MKSWACVNLFVEFRRMTGLRFCEVPIWKWWKIGNYDKGKWIFTKIEDILSTNDWCPFGKAPMTGARFHSQIMSKWSWKIDVNGKRKTNKECPKFSLNQKFIFFAGYWPMTDVFYAGYWPMTDVCSSKVPMTGAKLLCVTEIKEKCSKSSPN